MSQPFDVVTAVPEWLQLPRHPQRLSQRGLVFPAQRLLVGLPDLQGDGQEERQTELVLLLPTQISQVKQCRTKVSAVHLYKLVTQAHLGLRGGDRFFCHHIQVLSQWSDKLRVLDRARLRGHLVEKHLVHN